MLFAPDESCGALSAHARHMQDCVMRMNWATNYVHQVPWRTCPMVAAAYSEVLIVLQVHSLCIEAGGDRQGCRDVSRPDWTKLLSHTMGQLR